MVCQLWRISWAIFHTASVHLQASVRSGAADSRIHRKVLPSDLDLWTSLPRGEIGVTSEAANPGSPGIQAASRSAWRSRAVSHLSMVLANLPNRCQSWCSYRALICHPGQALGSATQLLSNLSKKIWIVTRVPSYHSSKIKACVDWLVWWHECLVLGLVHDMEELVLRWKYLQRCVNSQWSVG